MKGARCLNDAKPMAIKVETFRTHYLIRTPKVEKLSLQPIRCTVSGSADKVFNPEAPELNLCKPVRTRGVG